MHVKNIGDFVIEGRAAGSPVHWLLSVVINYISQMLGIDDSSFMLTIFPSH